MRPPRQIRVITLTAQREQPVFLRKAQKPPRSRLIFYLLFFSISLCSPGLHHRPGFEAVPSAGRRLGGPCLTKSPLHRLGAAVLTRCPQPGGRSALTRGPGTKWRPPFHRAEGCAPHMRSARRAVARERDAEPRAWRRARSGSRCCWRGCARLGRRVSDGSGDL